MIKFINFYALDNSIAKLAFNQMINTMKSLRRIITITLVALFASSAYALGLDKEVFENEEQDARTEAVMAYNNAQELAQNEDFVDAIEIYREALSIAQSPECEGCEDIVELVQNQVPRVYFSRATDAFERFRNDRSAEAADQAIQYFQEAADAGEEFGDTQVRDRSRAVIPQVYYNKSLVEYNMEDYSAAIESLDRAIELNENYTLAYYQKAIVLNNADADLEEVIEWFDRAIEVGESVGDSENVARAQRRAGAELLYQGVQRMDEDRMADALRMLDRAQQYIPQDADLHYRFAEVYNNRGSYNQAIEHANRALELESGGVSERAKIHFELGIAYKGLENVDQACTAFENAAYGDFRDPALHELEFELECEGYASSGLR